MENIIDNTKGIDPPKKNVGKPAEKQPAVNKNSPSLEYYLRKAEAINFADDVKKYDKDVATMANPRLMNTAKTYNPNYNVNNRYRETLALNNTDPTYNIEDLEQYAANILKEHPWELAKDTILGTAGKTWGGLLQGIASKFDLEDLYYRTIGDDTNHEYGNWLNDIGKNLNNWADDSFRAYQDNHDDTWMGNSLKWAERIQNMGPTIGFVGSEILSSMALAGVGRLALGAIQGVAKLNGITNITTSTIRGLSKLGLSTREAASLLSGASKTLGHLKNFGMGTWTGIGEAQMNALENQEAAFMKFKSEGYSDEEAHAKAKEVGRLSFNAEAVALGAINALQYGLFLKKATAVLDPKTRVFGEKTTASFGFSDAFESVGNKLFGKFIKNKTAQKVAGWATLASSEAFEEGLQTGIGKWAEDKVAGREFRAKEYWNEEMKEAMLQGGMGGLLLGAGFKSINKRSDNKTKKRIDGFLNQIGVGSTSIFKEYQQNMQYIEEIEAVISKEGISDEERAKLELEKSKMKNQAKANYEQAHNKMKMRAIAYDMHAKTGSAQSFEAYVQTMERIVKAVENKDTNELTKLGLLEKGQNIEDIQSNLDSIKDLAAKEIVTSAEFMDTFLATEEKFGFLNDPEILSEISLAQYELNKSEEAVNEFRDVLDEQLANHHEGYKGLEEKEKKALRKNLMASLINGWLGESRIRKSTSENASNIEELDNLIEGLTKLAEKNNINLERGTTDTTKNIWKELSEEEGSRDTLMQKLFDFYTARGKYKDLKESFRKLTSEENLLNYRDNQVKNTISKTENLEELNYLEEQAKKENLYSSAVKKAFQDKRKELVLKNQTKKENLLKEKTNNVVKDLEKKEDKKEDKSNKKEDRLQSIYESLFKRDVLKEHKKDFSISDLKDLSKVTQLIDIVSNKLKTYAKDSKLYFQAQGLLKVLNTFKSQLESKAIENVEAQNNNLDKKSPEELDNKLKEDEENKPLEQKDAEEVAQEENPNKNKGISVTKDDIITEAEYQTFLRTNVLPEKYLNKIARKMLNNEALTNVEKKVITSIRDKFKQIYKNEALLFEKERILSQAAENILDDVADKNKSKKNIADSVVPKNDDETLGARFEDENVRRERAKENLSDVIRVIDLYTQKAFSRNITFEDVVAHFLVNSPHQKVKDNFNELAQLYSDVTGESLANLKKTYNAFFGGITDILGYSASDNTQGLTGQALINSLTSDNNLQGDVSDKEFFNLLGQNAYNSRGIAQSNLKAAYFLIDEDIDKATGLKTRHSLELQQNPFIPNLHWVLDKQYINELRNTKKPLAVRIQSDKRVPVRFLNPISNKWERVPFENFEKRFPLFDKQGGVIEENKKLWVNFAPLTVSEDNNELFNVHLPSWYNGENVYHDGNEEEHERRVKEGYKKTLAFRALVINNLLAGKESYVKIEGSQFGQLDILDSDKYNTPENILPKRLPLNEAAGNSTTVAIIRNTASGGLQYYTGDGKQTLAQKYPNATFIESSFLKELKLEGKSGHVVEARPIDWDSKGNPIMFFVNITSTNDNTYFKEVNLHEQESANPTIYNNLKHSVLAYIALNQANNTDIKNFIYEEFGITQRNLIDYAQVIKKELGLDLKNKEHLYKFLNSFYIINKGSSINKVKNDTETFLNLKNFKKEGIFDLSFDNVVVDSEGNRKLVPALRLYDKYINSKENLHKDYSEKIKQGLRFLFNNQSEGLRNLGENIHFSVKSTLLNSNRKIPVFNGDGSFTGETIDYTEFAKSELLTSNILSHEIVTKDGSTKYVLDIQPIINFELIPQVSETATNTSTPQVIKIGLRDLFKNHPASAEGLLRSFGLTFIDDNNEPC